ncbi:MAG: lysylphosphatidylglycerol synthase transmembrane domain-containing protein [Deltaproteobacteria bacterium]|nr:lysylphosphatidylglycerol synthase transmembrane domain-containing protein [Deltaproteobacteria bacterium]
MAPGTVASTPRSDATDVTSPTPDAKRSTLGALWKSPLGTFVRVLCAVLPLVYLARKVNLASMQRGFALVGPRELLLSISSMLFSVTLASLRWRVLLHAYGANPQRMPTQFMLLRTYLVALYFNILPSGLAGDAVRGWRVAECLPDTRTSYLVLLIERLLGLCGLLLVAGIAFVLAPAGSSVSIVERALALGALATGVLSAVLFVLPQQLARSPALRARVAALPVAGKLLAELPIPRSWSGPALALALSVLVQALIVTTVAPLVMALSPNATLMTCARVVPAVVLVSYIPLTPGGLGQREAAFAHFFAPHGVSPAAAVTASLLFFVVYLAVSLLGGLVLAAERAAQRRST